MRSFHNLLLDLYGSNRCLFQQEERGSFRLPMEVGEWRGSKGFYTFKKNPCPLALQHVWQYPVDLCLFQNHGPTIPYLYAVNDLLLFYRIYPRLSPIPIPLWNPRKLRFWRVLQFFSSKVSSMLHLLIVKLIQVTFSSMSDSLRTGLWRCGLSSSFLNQVSGNNNSNKKKKKKKNKNSWLSWSKKNMQKIYSKKRIQIF